MDRKAGQILMKQIQYDSFFVDEFELKNQKNELFGQKKNPRTFDVLTIEKIGIMQSIKKTEEN